SDLYITPKELSFSAGDAAMETLRVTSTRALWDPNYTVPDGGFEDATGKELAPQLVPRLRQWVATFPGYSMTLFVVPQSQGVIVVPQPAITAAANAASYDSSSVAPGEIITIFGKGVGPTTIA